MAPCRHRETSSSEPSSPSSPKKPRVTPLRVSNEAPHGRGRASLGSNHEESHLVESDLQNFQIQYFILSFFRLVALGKNDKIFILPKGCVDFYEAALLFGLR